MKKLIINKIKLTDEIISIISDLCPFNAIEIKNGKIDINSACRLCGLCVKKGPPGVFEFEDCTSLNRKIRKSDWKGIAVYLDHENGEIHPVSFELIGKACELAGKINQEVYALCIGHQIEGIASEALQYGADRLYIYDQVEFENYIAEPYTAAMEDFINEVRPSVCLVGGTAVGRSLAPRIAARCRSGLTADCTSLDIDENTDLYQIRPAFGDNIMAKIKTPDSRPQFATVRYKIFQKPEKSKFGINPGMIFSRSLSPGMLASGVKIHETTTRKKIKGIEEAEIIIAAGRGVKKKEDLIMLQKLADLLGGHLASTRSLIEAGWVDARKQIGLSGRTVKPKLIITCGVSGAIQFIAGMNSSETIIAINTDPEAPIMKTAHYGIVGDLYEVVPGLISRISSEQNL